MSLFTYIRELGRRRRVADEIDDELAFHLAMREEKLRQAGLAGEVAPVVARERFGDPEEFGRACAFLCSAQAGFITGQSLLIDGGAYPGIL